MMTTFDTTNEKASESGETLALGGNARNTKSNKPKFNTLSPRLERMLSMLLAAPKGLSVKELLPIGTTHTPNQTKELRDCYGFELPMERIYFDPKNKSRFYGRFSLSVSDRVMALQLLGGAL
jgi:hypothetical protein